MSAEAYILKTRAGHWAFDVQQDGQSIGGGGGYPDPHEAMEAAQEAFPHLTLQMVLQEPEE